MLLKNEWFNSDIKKEIKSIWKQMKMNIQEPKSMGHREGSPQR